jgi:hypothetical protein
MGDNGTLVHMSISACRRNNNGARVVVFLLDEQMRGPDWINFLPVMVIEGADGYVEFVPSVQRAVAEWFGDDFAAAEAKVDAINAERGISHDEMMSIVGRSMEAAEQYEAAERDHAS